MSFGDAFLSGFKWYRRWRGGRWWHCVGVHGEYRGLSLWVHEKPPSVITVVEFEWW